MKSKASKYVELFNEAAARLDIDTMLSGRLTIQAEALEHMPADVIGKLAPRPDDRLLEIGCGIGLLLTPLAARVKEAVGIDGEQVVARLRNKGLPPNVTLIGGEWPSDKPEGTFDRILVYSVLHYQEDRETAFEFVQQCTDILRPGGALLLGDLPNRDSRRRFAEAPEGAKFDLEWSKSVEKFRTQHAEFYDIFARYGGVPKPYFNDSFILELMARTRAQGLESYLLPQGEDLPFFHTREDMLIRRRA